MIKGSGVEGVTVAPQTTPLPHQLVFIKVQKQSNGERITFSTNGTGTCTDKEMKLDLNSNLYGKINSKWIPDLNVKH